MIKSEMSSQSTLSKWQMKSGPRLALPCFILLAALFHLSTIYLFKIIYQPSHVSKPIPAQVFFLLPQSPSSQEISLWLKSNDPSIFSPLKTVQATRTSLPSSIYEPGPDSLPLHSLPIVKKHSTDLLPPVNEPVLPFSPTPNSTSSATVDAARPQLTTAIQLLDPLPTRIAGPLGIPLLPPEASFTLPPTKLTLNIDAEGIPRHVSVLQSCGNTSADEAATRWAMTLRFSKADQETWGTLLVIWGKNS